METSLEESSGAPARCRGCGEALHHVFVDLGLSPLANDYLTLEQLGSFQTRHPLKAFVCEHCLLVQLEQFEAPEAIFREDYAYYSSYSDSWLAHLDAYVEMMVQRFGFDGRHRVIELASNDGCLLQYFVKKGIPVLGIDPAANAARIAEQNGVPSLVRFFGTEVAGELVEQDKMADLIIGNNVLAHVPDLHDFVAGMKRALKPTGIITMEFPHFLNLIQKNQFDTIYHEHFSYFSFLAVQKVFASEGLTIFDVQEVPTHGGSLRIFARHSGADAPAMTERPAELERREREAKLDDMETYRAFSRGVVDMKRKLLEMLRRLHDAGANIAAYGAPAKGNTLLNYCGVGPETISFTVDRNPAKQDHFLPGSRIPVFHPDRIREARPDFVLILPWNLRDEVMQQLSFIREWGGQFIIPIPAPQIVA